MRWFVAKDGTRFLVQTPDECARSLRQAFADTKTPLTPRRFMEHLRRELPPEPRRVARSAR